VTREHQPSRKRGRPRKYTPWIDEDGVDRALSDHPNYNPVRTVVERSPELWPPDAICLEWRNDLAVAVYGVTDAVGLQPSKRHNLTTIEPGQVLGPETALWWPRPWANTRRARHALGRRAAEGVWLPAVVLSRLGREPIPHVERTLRLNEALRQRDRCDELCDCTRLYECDLHAAARRAGDDEVA
jgi:hypothetical protein